MTYLDWSMAKSRKMTYREKPNPGIWLNEISQILAYIKPEMARPKINNHDLVLPVGRFAKSQQRIWWNQHPKAIFWVPVIPACGIDRNF
jgi:hypothetical protein